MSITTGRRRVIMWAPLLIGIAIGAFVGFALGYLRGVAEANRPATASWLKAEAVLNRLEARHGVAGAWDPDSRVSVN